MNSFDTTRQDVLYAFRQLKNSPGFTAIAVISLALGIGANTAIFSVMDAVMLRSLPVKDPQELLQVLIGTSPSYTNPIWEQLRDRQDVFTAAFAWSRPRYNLANGGEVKYANGVMASGGFFLTLGVPAAAGRLFGPEDDRPGCASIAVLSHSFWQRRYGGKQDAVGSTLHLDGHPFQVIGVSADGFSGVDIGRSFDVAVPICTEPVIRGENSSLDQRSSWWLSVIGRPRPGMTAQQVTARLKVIAPQVFEATTPQQWKSEDAKEYRTRSFETKPAGAGLSQVRSRYGTALNLLMGVVSVVLLIACANIANLMLARATSRQREMAVRLAMGASRWRIMRQLLTESVLLSLLGAALGLLLARWGASLLVKYISSSNNMVFLDLGLDLRMLAFTAAVAIVTGMLFGLAPAFRSTKVPVNSALKEGGRSNTASRSNFRMGRALVALQLTLSLLLLVGAGLFVRTFLNLALLDAGFVKDNVLLVSIDIRAGSYPKERRAALYNEIETRMRGIPAIRFASRSNITPVSGSSWNNILLTETFVPKSRRDGLSWFNRVSPGYFGTLGIPLIAGRDFNDHDSLTSPQVAIINESVAKKFFAGVNPIGRTYRTETKPGVFETTEIIGLVKDAKYDSLKSEDVGTVFLAESQDKVPSQYTNLVLRTALPTSDTIPFVKDAMRSVDNRISMTFQNLATQLNDATLQERLLAVLSGFFAALALLLASVGLYGVISYMVTARRNEIGIRMALGADRGTVLWLVLREVAILLTIGLTAGAAAASVTTKLAENMLFGVKANDPLTIVVAITTLAAIATLAGYLPAHRASQVDPMTALRQE